MKRTFVILGYILFALLALLPFGTLISSCFGYTFELASVTVFAIVTALLSVCLVILSIIKKEACEGGAIKVLFALLAPLSFISAVFYFFECSTVLVITSAFVFIGFCYFLTVKHGKPLILKIIALVLSSLMILPIGFFSFIAFFFGNIGQNTVVQSVESPSGAYRAELVDSDQGALGGDTLVNVYENKGINALVFKISKKPQRVYQGEWGEFKSMKIYWKNDSCLVINSAEFEFE